MARIDGDRPVFDELPLVQLPLGFELSSPGNLRLQRKLLRVHLPEFPSLDLSGTTFSVEPRCGGPSLDFDGVVRGVPVQEIDKCCVILKQITDVGRRISYQHRSHQFRLETIAVESAPSSS
jgi:diadenosine tetraphosphatase ApaH/serine/threonine PP2A family protein phosphatase